MDFNSVCVGTAKGNDTRFKPLNELILEKNPQIHDRNLLLKLDCEGCEWDVFDKTDETTLLRFRTIVTEFHWLDKSHDHSKYLRVMEKLLKHFRIVHTHGCNCFGTWTVNGTTYGMPRIVEATLVRNELSTQVDCVASEYIPTLDRPNCPKNSELSATDFSLG